MPKTEDKASFIPPMLLQRVSTLPDNRTQWLYQLKLDGYRAIGFKRQSKLFRFVNGKRGTVARLWLFTGGLRIRIDDYVS